MLRRLALILVAFLITTLSAAQTAGQTAAPGAAKKPATRKPPAAASAAAGAGPGASGSVGPNTPVMFVSGLCALQGANVPAIAVPPRPGMPAGTCMRAVTKSQFEMMVAGLGERAAQADKTQLAEYYIRGLMIDNEARKLKLDQDPRAAEAIWMGRIAALGEALHRHFQKQFANIPDSDITAYYGSHKSEFEEVTIRRIIIPKPQQKAAVVKPGQKAEGTPDSPSATKPGAPAAEVPYDQQLAARKTYSEKLIERAKAGEAFDKLQKDAFKVAGLESAAPDTEAVAIHHGQIPPAHETKVFALQPGQYSALIDEPSAYVFYKVESRRTVPLAEVREDIKGALRNQKEDEAIKKVFLASKPNLNPAYFAPPKAPAEAPEATQPQAEPQHEHHDMETQTAPEQAAPQASPPAGQTPPATEPPKQEPPK